MTFAESVERRERPALLIAQMFQVEEANRMIQLFEAKSGWRLADLMPRGGTARGFFIALVNELLLDPCLAAKFVRAVAESRPRRLLDVAALADMLKVPIGGACDCGRQR